MIGHTTAPQLQSAWFSATYWRVAGIAAVLTLPFLFAAAIQALVHSDLSLLARAAFGFLPLAMLGVGIAAPLTMLLLAATDQLSAVVSSAAGHASTHFLNRASAGIGALTLLSRSPFLVFFAGLLTVGAAIVVWFELLLRAAAVYVIVLMLPLAFAALVWPARRIWAIRAVEVLVALILSKFLIVAVLSLGGAALSQSFLSSISGMLAGFVLLTLGALSPWALLRLLPLGEIASAAVGSLRAETLGKGGRLLQAASGGGAIAHDWGFTTAEMRRDADGFVDAADPVSGPGRDAARAAGRTDWRWRLGSRAGEWGRAAGSGAEWRRGRRLWRSGKPLAGRRERGGRCLRRVLRPSALPWDGPDLAGRRLRLADAQARPRARVAAETDRGCHERGRRALPGADGPGSRRRSTRHRRRSDRRPTQVRRATHPGPTATDPGPPAADGGAPTSSAEREDHDPRPSPQPPEDGSL